VNWWTWPALRGAVLEQIPGRLVDIGAGGCSLETSARLTSGTFGFVEIQGPDASLAEVVRVCDVIERPGAATRFIVRLEFLPIALPAHLAGDRLVAAEGSLAGAAEKAGSNLTPVRRRKANGPAENVSSAQDDTDAHGDAGANGPGATLADRLK
jgi:hypothetical protein